MIKLEPNIANLQVKKFNFPAGEMQITISPIDDTKYFYGYAIPVTWVFNGNDDIIELMLFNDALGRIGLRIGDLTIPYFPFARQDRVANNGEPLSVKVMADIINRLIIPDKVIVYDPHSDVTPALLDRVKVIQQHEIFAPLLELQSMVDGEKFYLISPDGGALKKINKLAQAVSNKCLGVIECSKIRDTKTGSISGTVVHEDPKSERLNGKYAIIVDDICDGGRTFIEIAKILKNVHKVSKVTLCVTHGFFTNGLGVFDGLIDKIYTMEGMVI